MKVAILAGGTGSRLAEYTTGKPKALVGIGGRPILHHVMASYAQHGFKEFVVAAGHLGDQIEGYFESASTPPDWSIVVVDTGDTTKSGGRIKRLAPVLGAAEFMLTWCDGLSDVDLGRLLDFHRTHKRLATVTVVHPEEKFGCAVLDGDRVVEFDEKPKRTQDWINGAFFVLEPGIFDYIEGDTTEWERGPMQSLAMGGELMAYRHEGFWQCMDTVHERNLLEALWQSGAAPWSTAKPQMNADER